MRVESITVRSGRGIAVRHDDVDGYVLESYGQGNGIVLQLYMGDDLVHTYKEWASVHLEPGV